MDDLEDDFIFPLSMSGISLNSEKKEISCSQTSAINRLSKTYRKERKDNMSSSQISSISSHSKTFKRETKGNISYSRISPVNRLSKSLRKKNGSSSPSVPDSIVLSNSDDLERGTTSSLQFCPTCQAPFEIMNINPIIHANQCSVTRIAEMEECPSGEMCYSDNIFHYRDYAHTILAQIRASRGHLEHIPNITPSKTSGNKIRKNSTFKAPSCRLVNGNVSNAKMKLFSDSESVISLNTDSSKDTNIKTCLNRISNSRIGNADNNNYISTPTNKDIKEQDRNKHLKVNQVIYGPEISSTQGNQIVYGPNISNIITVNRNKRPRIEDSDTESTQSSPNCKNSDFKMPTKKRKIENSLTSSANTNVKNHNLSFNKMKISKKVSESFSESQKTNKKELTILDIIDTSIEENLDNSEEEFCTQKEKDTGLYESDNKVKHDLIEECKNCKTNNLPHNKKGHSISENAKEVRATLSVVVSPTDTDLDDGKDPPETPVKVDASCDKSGWRTIGIAAPSTTEVENVKVSVCNCNKTMEVNCSLSKNQTLFDVTDNGNLKKEALELKYFSHVNEPKQFNKLNEPYEPANHQMSITSYFRTSKQPSTLSLKSSIESASIEVKPCSSSIQTQKSNWIDNDIQEVTTSGTTKHNKELAVASWKQILKGMAQKGKSTLNVMSENSISTTDTNTSFETTRTYKSSKKECPFYKKIPDTTFVVDAFQYGAIPRITHYFLSHFHYDHYGGLKKSFSYPLYCSKITAALVKMKIGVNEQYVHELELDTPRNIRGVLVTALDANHCPGSVMFLFQLQDGRNFLHVGDFRADPKMESYPCFWNLTIHKLFLDTTYCEPKYDFPMQSETITRVVELAMEHHSRSPSTLFVCGTYTIGKEKVFIGIAEALNCKIWAHPDKRKVLDCIDNPVINKKLTKKQLEAQVHVCRMSDLKNEFLQRYLKQHIGVFTHLVAFVPTGWEMKTGRSRDSDDINMTSYGNITIYGVPYSEHSSFSELKRFVQFLKPEEVIPTVNMGNITKRASMQKYFKQWLSESSLMVTKVKKQVQPKMSHYFQNSRHYFNERA